MRDYDYPFRERRIEKRVILMRATHDPVFKTLILNLIARFACRGRGQSFNVAAATSGG